MQVHKETIDKVPNSAPTRGNIEVEIYGMEGIPEADLKAHEAGRDDDDDVRRDKSDSPAVPTPPLQAGPQLPAGMGGVPPGMMQIPGMRPQFMPGPGMAWGMPGAPGMMPQVRYSGQPTVNEGPRPLFPAAANADGQNMKAFGWNSNQQNGWQNQNQHNHGFNQQNPNFNQQNRDSSQQNPNFNQQNRDFNQQNYFNQQNSGYGSHNRDFDSQNQSNPSFGGQQNSEFNQQQGNNFQWQNPNFNQRNGGNSNPNGVNPSWR